MYTHTLYKALWESSSSNDYTVFLIHWNLNYLVTYCQIFKYYSLLFIRIYT